MYAMILYEKLNFAWSEVSDPAKKADEVMIKIHVAEVNRAALMQKDGCYAFPKDWPQLLAGSFRSSTGNTSRCR